LRGRVDPELLADRRHGDRQGGPVDIVDGDDQQNEQEYAPSDRSFSCELKRSCHRCLLSLECQANENTFRGGKIESESMSGRTRRCSRPLKRAGAGAASRWPHLSVRDRERNVGIPYKSIHAPAAQRQSTGSRLHDHLNSLRGWLRFHRMRATDVTSNWPTTRLIRNHRSSRQRRNGRGVPRTRHQAQTRSCHQDSAG
jgi:hypothetical protein